MKKVLALVLALATAASMAVSSFAADGYTVDTFTLSANQFKNAAAGTDLSSFQAADNVDSNVTLKGDKDDIDNQGEVPSTKFDNTTTPTAVVVSYKVATLKADLTFEINVKRGNTVYTATRTLPKTTAPVKPGIGGDIVTSTTSDNHGADGQLLPGETYEYDIPADVLARMDSKSVVSASWSVGGAMVDSYKIIGNEGAYQFSLKVNENYTLTDLKDLKGTLTFKKLDSDHKGTITLAFENIDGTPAQVANDFDGTWKGYSNRDDAEDDIHTVANNTVYEIDGSGWVCFGDEGRLIQVLAKFSDEQRIFAYFNENKIDAVLDKYDDGEATIDFIKFPAKPSLKKTSTITFDRGFSTKGYIYEWANGKLNNIKGAKWDSEDGTWTIETNKLGDYVFSDEKLISETSEASSESESSSDTGSTTEPNPGTGASDFVGLAVALAVVSVAGIAVAKRK